MSSGFDTNYGRIIRRDSLITVSGFPRPGYLIEIQGMAVIGGK
jgi:hypothetical protein